MKYEIYTANSFRALATSGAQRRKAAAIGALAVALNAFAGHAGADVTATTQSPPASTDKLEEIVVTAQKRNEYLQDVPITVEVVDQDLLKAQGISGSMGLGLVVPGFQGMTDVDSFVPHLRGVGNTATGPGIENSVATYVDGVYYAAAPGDLLDLDNIQQIEVLKGPQGTLFGRNATGGLVQITTKDPSTDFGAQASVSYANYQTARASGYITGGLTDTLAVNFAAQGVRQGQGWGTDIANGEQNNQLDRDYSLRGKVLYKPTAATTVKLTADYRASGDSLGTFRAPSNLPPGFPGAIGYVNPPGPWDTDNTFPTSNSFQGGGASVRVDQDLAAAQLVSITAYRGTRFSSVFDDDLGPIGAEQLSLLLRERQFSQEVQLLSPIGQSLKWVAGLFYFHDNFGTEPADVTLGGPLIAPTFPLSNIIVNSTGTIRSIAGFAQATAELGARTNFTVGIRYTAEDRTIKGTTEGLLRGGFPIGALAPPANQSQTFDKLTWRFALDHKFTDTTLGFVSYNRGFKSGGFNTTIPNDPAYAPEVLDAYEIGLKTDVLDNQLRLNTSIFYYDYKNIQVARFESGVIGIYNGAGAKLYGLDLDAKAVLGHGFSLTGGLEYLHDRFTSFPNATGSILSPGGGFTLLPGGNQPGVNAAGNELPDSPTFTAFVSANKTFAISSGNVDLNVSDSYNSGYFGEPDNFLRQPSFNWLSASLRWTASDNRFSVKFWGSNLLNKAVSSQLSTLALAYAYAYANPPRTYGVTFDFKTGSARQ
jgi:iron complex outermembrane receptor protein